MKNSKLVFFFGGTLILLMFLTPLTAMCQEAAQEAARTGIFSKTGDWFKGNFLTIGVGVVFGLIPMTVRQTIKSFAAKGALFFTELSHLSGDISVVCDKVDQAIKADGSMPDKNSIADVIAAKKEVVIELKDMIAVFKPK